jgi:hypothetical protein
MTAAECLPPPHLMCTAAPTQSAMAAAAGNVDFQSCEPQARTSARASHCLGSQAPRHKPALVVRQLHLQSLSALDCRLCVAVLEMQVLVYSFVWLHSVLHYEL